jgi:hypothetical protein
MKIEHNIWFPELISTSEKEVKICINGLDEYLPEDFNILLAMEALCAANVLPANEIEGYQQFKQQGLAEKKVVLPNVVYTGPLADAYTRNQAIIDEFRSNPDYQTFSRQLFEACHFDGEMPVTDESLAILQERVFEIEQKNWKIMKEIQTELGVEISTTSWPRLPNGFWDYSLPAKLHLEVFEYHTSLGIELQEIAEKFISSFSWNPNTLYEDVISYELNIQLQ